jgi:hypothetical protein
MVARWHGESVEAPLPDLAAATLLLALTPDLGRPEPLQPLAAIAVAVGPNHKGDVMGHPAVSPDAQGEAGAGLSDALHQVGVVALVGEDRVASVAPIEGVAAETAPRGSCRAWPVGHFRLADEREQEDLARSPFRSALSIARRRARPRYHTHWGLRGGAGGGTLAQIELGEGAYSCDLRLASNQTTKPVPSRQSQEATA